MLKQITTGLLAAMLITACGKNDNSTIPAAENPSAANALTAAASGAPNTPNASTAKPAQNEDNIRQVTVQDEQGNPVNACVESYRYLAISSISVIKSPLAMQNLDQNSAKASFESAKSIGDNLVKAGLMTTEQRAEIDKAGEERAKKLDEIFQLYVTGNKAPYQAHFDEMLSKQKAVTKYVSICDPVLVKLQTPATTAAGAANPLGLTEGVEYHYYDDGSCTKNCLTAQQAQQACALVKGHTKGMISTLSVVHFSGKRKALLDGGSVTDFTARWDGKNCMLSLTVAGLYEGTSSRENFYGRGSGFVYVKGEILSSYLDSF